MPDQPNQAANTTLFALAESRWLTEVLQSDFTATTLSGGANNQGFCLKTSSDCFFLKRFADTSNARQKLEQEAAFSQTLYQLGIRNIAVPVAQHSTLRLSLFSFINGEPVRQLQPHHIQAALTFVEQINQQRSQVSQVALAAESPACLADFAQIVANRLSRLRAVAKEGPLAAALQALLADISRQFDHLCQDIPVSWQLPLDRSYLSPSDFGFHNALETANGLYFIDFEYAGRDSLWKLFSDFFAQPAIAVPLHYTRLFFQQPLFVELANDPTSLLKVYQLTQLKWSLLMLNEFLPDVLARRLHSNNFGPSPTPSNRVIALQQAQLHKSQQYFQQIAPRTAQLNQGLSTHHESSRLI